MPLVPSPVTTPAVQTREPLPVPMPDTPSLTALAARVAGVLHQGGGPSTDLEPAITDVTHDSRAAGPGVLFAARPGATSDGHDFAAAAVGAGAPALLVERLLPLDVPQIVVPSVADALGPMAAAVHGEPSQAMTVVGVTGTNGKTTTAFLLEAAFAAAGHRTGLVGTVETRVAGTVVPGVRTTPESTDLQRLLARMRAVDVDAVAMEVSSHGLALGRVRGTRFAAVGFTNLSHDHLDFHADLEDYFLAKASLFDPQYAPVGVVNLDDEAGRRLARTSPIPVVGVSTDLGHGVSSGEAPSGGRSGMRSPVREVVTATDVVLRPDGSVFTARLPDGAVEVRVRLPGPFNVSNALVALVLARAAGVDPTAAAEGIAALAAVPGRMERVPGTEGYEVIVDYAHTPDALQRVLEAARAVAHGRVLVVVGCGGDRDAAKRPVMGRLAATLADVAVLTSDNPRSEDPEAILDAMAAGAATAAGGRVLRRTNRREAIGLAVAEARPGDVVVIAGKGHEPVQEIAGRTIEFDDRRVAAEALRAVRGAT